MGLFDIFKKEPEEIAVITFKFVGQHYFRKYVEKLLGKNYEMNFPGGYAPTPSGAMSKYMATVGGKPVGYINNDCAEFIDTHKIKETAIVLMTNDLGNLSGYIHFKYVK